MILNGFDAFVRVLYENANERKIGEGRFHSDFPDCSSLNQAQIQSLGCFLWVCVMGSVDADSFCGPYSWSGISSEGPGSIQSSYATMITSQLITIIQGTL